MKKMNGIALAVACTLGGQMASAQAKIDTTKVNKLSEVVVKGVRAPKSAPFAVANIKKSELQNFSKTGKELPFLLQQTPGVLAWSENGMGTGTVYMRMRGAAGSRINVTLDGVPLNSPEDQTVFWANMNSYASMLGSVQIQRGVGSSTNGDGAFGGSLSLAMATPSLTPSLELTGSYGSFNTYNAGLNFSTGLIGKHFIFDGAYHETSTDGYIHGTDGRSGSYYGGLTWLGNNFKLSYKNVGNFEKTGQAWCGVLESDYDTNFSMEDYGIHSYKDMYNHGMGRYNVLTEVIDWNEEDWKNGKFTTQPHTLRDGSKWDRTTDNFYQNHNILSATWSPSEHWSHHAALHYTYGYGYYKEFRIAKRLNEKFGINEFGTDGKGLKSEAIRRKGLTQNTYGGLYNASYKDDAWDVVGGVNVQLFRANHWGYLSYIANESIEKKYLNGGEYKYYDSDADKDDYSWFIKADHKFAAHWNVFADMQMRYVGYKTDGINDRFVVDKVVDGKKYYTNQRLDVDEHYFFVNPKAGIAFSNNGHKAYASIAYSNREPERNNFTDNGSYPAPTPERLLDLEWGYQYQGSNWHAGANFYYMDYVNQFVQTGAKSDIGEALTTNIKDSYRLGVELSAGWSPLTWLSLEGNAALSKNKLKNLDEIVEDWSADSHERTIHYENNTLAYSPSAILNGFLNIHFGGFRATWHTNFVSRQYLDNSESVERSLPSFSQTDINLNYTINVAKKFIGMKSVTIGADFNNIFDRHYAPSGSVWYSWFNDNKRYQAISYVPMAGFTAMGHLTLNF